MGGGGGPLGVPLGTTWTKLPVLLRDLFPRLLEAAATAMVVTLVMSAAELRRPACGGGGAAPHAIPRGIALAVRGLLGCPHLSTHIKIMCFDFSVLMTEMERTPVRH